PQHRRAALRARRVHGEGGRPLRRAYRRPARARRRGARGVPRRRRRSTCMRRLLSVAVAALGTVLLVTAPSSASTSARSGWWTSVPLAAAPDVPADGILLQGGPAIDSPVAYGAVAFALEADDEPSELTLAVADGSA